MHRNDSTCRHRIFRISELLLASYERDVCVWGGGYRKGTGLKMGGNRKGGKGEREAERKGGGRNFSLSP